MWVSWKPSMLTTQGSITSGSSAILKDMIERSMASWPFSVKRQIQPLSRWGMMSPWSFQMLSGPDTARLALAMQMGSLIAETMGRISCISMSPWELVAV